VHETLTIDRQGAVATVWMNRAEVHNAFNETLIRELHAAVAALTQEAGVRVLVLAGRGRSFSAGADLNWMQRAAAASMPDNLEDARRLAALLQALAGARIPTVARVHGAALGGGVGLAAACDLCIAADDASFAMTEVRLGLIPAVISPYVVRAMGARQALRYMLSAERLSAARAAQLGLVHEVVPPGELDERLQALCAALCAGGPQSQAAVKRLLTALGGGLPDPAVIEHTAQAIAAQRAAPEAQAGLAAFFARQPPPWTLPPGA